MEGDWKDGHCPPVIKYSRGTPEGTLEGGKPRRYFRRMSLLRILVTLKRQNPGGKNKAHGRGCTKDPQWWGGGGVLNFITPSF